MPVDHKCVYNFSQNTWVSKSSRGWLLLEQLSDDQEMHILIASVWRRTGPSRRPLWTRRCTLGCINTGNLTFICRCIVNIFLSYNQQDAKFLNFFYFYRRSTCFRRFLRPSSGAQKLYTQLRVLSTNTVACRYHGWDGTLLSSTVAASSSAGRRYLKLYVQFLYSWWWAKEPPETCRASVEINKSRNVASCWL